MGSEDRIYLSGLFGKQYDIGKKANLDKNKYLSGKEISIFISECKSQNVEYKPNMFEKGFNWLCSTWDSLFEETPKTKKILESDDIGIYKTNTTTIIDGNSTTISKTLTDNNDSLKYEKKITILEENGTTTVKYSDTRFANNEDKKHDVAFQYNRNDIENYIINDAIASDGKKITYFSKIPDIRNKPESERTENEQQLLAEFENMIDNAIAAGLDYGVDPKAIIAIIQREVTFQGLNTRKDVCTSKGKGYMQITSKPIKDFLGYYSEEDKNSNIQTGYRMIKTWYYGQEMAELLESRGFNVTTAKTRDEKDKLAEQIENYLIANEDHDFNIRFGTLVLRRYMDTTNGDLKKAAYKYNNNATHRENYQKHVGEIYNVLNKNLA